MSTGFVHLHVHSEYSLVDSTVRLKPLIDKVVARDMGAVALTDMSNLFALVKLYKSAIAAGVKPIFGADLWIRHDDRPQSLSRLVLLCQNDAGYLNLKQLISRSYQEGQVADRPTIAAQWLDGHTDGLLALSAALEGDVGHAIRSHNLQLAEDYLDQWQALFPGRYFLELQRTGRPHEEAYIQQALQYSVARSIPVVASNDVRFIDATDYEAHEVRVCICSGFTLEDKRRPRHYSEQQYLRSSEEMINLFKDIPQAIENTVNIAMACNVTLTLGKNYLPAFPIPEGHTEDSYFRHVSEQGLAGDAVLDTGRHEIRLGDEEVQATRIEFALLEHLCRRPTEVASRAELLESVWGPNWVGDTHVVDVHLSNLRRKLGPSSGGGPRIETVRGIGYQYVVPETAS